MSHLGFCTLGIFALNPAGISGSIIQQINHGISTGMLFLIVGIVYERRHTREISEYGGLMRVMPIFTVVFGMAALSSMGMPPLNGFIGEITILGGAYQVSLNWAFWAAVGIALGAAYLLWLFQRTMLGEVKEKNRGLKDLSLARNRGLRAANRVGLLDRPEPPAVLPRAGPLGGADRGARAPRLLRRAAPAEPAGSDRDDGGDPGTPLEDQQSLVNSGRWSGSDAALRRYRKRTAIAVQLEAAHCAAEATSFSVRQACPRALFPGRNSVCLPTAAWVRDIAPSRRGTPRW